jgi:hypothetical protein
MRISTLGKITPLPVTCIVRKIGAAGEDVMLQVTRALALFLGIG